MRWRFRLWKQRDSDLNDEIAYDLAADAEERIRSGIPREEAEQATRRDFGNVTLLKEDLRAMWGWTWLQWFGQDLRYGLRSFAKNPLFTTMAVLSLALGIGANTAIYSIMDTIMIRALPVRNPGELVILNWRAKQDPAVVQSHNGSSYDDPGGRHDEPRFPVARLRTSSETQRHLLGPVRIQGRRAAQSGRSRASRNRRRRIRLWQFLQQPRNRSCRRPAHRR